MRRREFLLGSVGCLSGAVGSPLYGQQPTKTPVLGFLVTGTQASHGAWVTTFTKRLSELGWTEGRNIKILYRWAAGDTRQIAEFATEFAREQVDIIVTSANGTVASKQATSTIPIVFAAFGDPVVAGLTASLARPGGNVTGLTVQPSDLNGKRLQLLREIMPSLRRLAALVNFGVPGADQEEASIRSAAMSLSIDTDILAIRTADDIDEAMEKLKGRADALYVFSEPPTPTGTRSLRLQRLRKFPLSLASESSWMQEG
jgi:putative tryptophan/tyrosine transport system substrate-binding protein